jgi:hypothetical protein
VERDAGGNLDDENAGDQPVDGGAERRLGRLADPTEEESPILRAVTDVHISGFSIGGFTNPAVEIYGAQRVSLSDTTAGHDPGGGVFVGRSARVLVDRVTAAGNGARGIDVQQGVTDLTPRAQPGDGQPR